MRDQETAHFITLTYGDGQATRTANGHLTLNYEHVQHFFKRLRQLHNGQRKKHLRETKRAAKQKRTIRHIFKIPKKAFNYYVAGEYGSKTRRPHYHIILFNAAIELVPRAWGTNNSGRWVARGHVHTGTITGSSIRYTLKYISKPSRLPLFEGDDRARESSHMSKGIGKNYVTKQMIAWHKADLLNRYYVPGAGGIQTTMPRYYAKKIYTDQERIFIAEHLERKMDEEFRKLLSIEDNVIRHVINARNAFEHKQFTKKYSQL